ncbi:MAG: hypothetical protein GY768_10340 [Planctomycetaceae bacterium]|nr:hypothetical protein [Planctomycetaceae bacterium]
MPLKSQSKIFLHLLIVLVTCGFVAKSTLRAAETQFQVTVNAGDVDRHQVPVTIPFQLPESLQNEKTARIIDADGKASTGQITRPALLAGDGQGANSRELVFILTKLAAGKSATYDVQISTAAEDLTEGSFAWNDHVGQYAQLSYDGRPILRYMYTPFDTSSAESREQTIKVFHHLFDPTGQQIVTKGPGGKFSHHRGLFYGFNRIRYGTKQADIWHCRKGESQQHVSFEALEAGPVLGRHRLAIDWRGQDGAVFAKELRELTVYHVPGGQLVEFASHLSSTVGPVRLDGDPQHAGFQFRASQEVAARTHPQTYYLRPDGRGKLAETRNWKPDQPSHRNLPWNAQSFVLGDQRFTCCYLDHPTNPKPARYSERDYGRFGSYFEYDLDEDRPLKTNYRIWLQTGEMDVPTVAARSSDFVSPPSVTLKRK